MENSGIEATQDERVLAALAHAGAIIPFWGLIGAVVIWATQREKSRLVHFQALQGVAYQLSLFVCGFVAFGCYMCSMFGTFLGPLAMIPAGVLAAEGSEELGIISLLLGIPVAFFPFCLIGILALAGLALVLYGLYGAARVLQGHDFRYALIGRWLERYMSQEGAEDIPA